MQSIAARLGSAPRAAHGILTVCNEAMAEAIRAVTIRRGIDPRGFALVAFGGAGPVHAGRVAEALGMRTVVVPPRPGVLAAEGLLQAPIEEERNAMFFRTATSGESPAIRRTLDRIADEAGRRLGETAANDGSCTRFAADMRYAGQAYEIEVAIDPADADLVAPTVARFQDAYSSICAWSSAASHRRCRAACPTRCRDRRPHRRPRGRSGSHPRPGRPKRRSFREPAWWSGRKSSGRPSSSKATRRPSSIRATPAKSTPAAR
jgi:N-methylhydantoinase A/oxoprolinase/acetone carboxylase beta subunit